MTGEFYARIVRTDYDQGLGQHRLILTTNDWRDRRHVIVYQKQPFFVVLTENDPHILTDFHTHGRALLPVWKLILDDHLRIVEWTMLPLSREEEITKKSREHLDRLHDLGRSLHIGYAAMDEIIRDVQRMQAPDWPDLAAEALKAYANTRESNRLLVYIATHKNERDYWGEYEWRPLSIEERDRKAAMHAYAKDRPV